jgi:NAD(P)-dependent dehydrogenase (short-subunit alcohol dehydrogenase family)
MSQFPSPASKFHSSTYPSIDPTRPELSLAGKSVIITGGGAGIGLAISKSLALAGTSKLAIIGRRTEVLEKAKATIHELVGNKTQVFTVSADVADKSQVEKAFSQIKSEFGQPLDILVNNAGYFTGVRPLGEETVDEWTTAFNINIKGLYVVATTFIKHAKTDATLINISTGLAHLPASFRTGFSSYSSTKLAGSKIMEFIQAEYPSLHVVDLHPGQVTETEMAGKAGGAGMGHIDDGMLGFRLIRTKHFANNVSADLAGNFTVWAASPEAKFLKGKFVWVKWDVDELKANAKVIEDTDLFTLGLTGFSNFGDRSAE